MPDDYNDGEEILVPQNTREPVQVYFNIGNVEFINNNDASELEEGVFEYTPVFRLPMTPNIFSRNGIIPAIEEYLSCPYRNMTKILQESSREMQRDIIEANRTLRRETAGRSLAEYSPKIAHLNLILLHITFNGSRVSEAVLLPDIPRLEERHGRMRRYISHEFITYALGSEFARIADNVLFIFIRTGGNHAAWPIRVVFIDPSDVTSGGYNPDFSNPQQRTLVGRVGLEMHELWHHVQYRQRHQGTPFFNLVRELIGRTNPYNAGDPREHGVLDSLAKFDSETGELNRRRHVG